MPYAKHNIRVTVPKKSGFDKSHRNTGSLTCGTITPILCDEVIPGTRVHLKMPIALQLPPLASDTYMNIKLKAEAFFVPMRLLCGSFEDFFSDFSNPALVGGVGESDAFVYSSGLKYVVPSLELPSTLNGSAYVKPGSLLDYLGFKSPLGYISSDSQPVLNPMPLVAYHLVYQEWYRNPRVQKPAFVPVRRAVIADTDAAVPISAMPFYKYAAGVDGSIPTYSASAAALSPGSTIPKGSLVLADGINLLSLRQRNFGLDYFTGARVDAQQGEVSSVVVPLTGDDAGKMTIAQLRAANSLQQFRERNNLPSPRMVDQVKARYGANLADGVAQRPICIGTASYDISSTGISQTGGDSASTENPFSGIAAQYGRAYAAGNDVLIEDFTANEPGYILVNVTLVPDATYASGCDRMLYRYTSPGSIVEMATPLLQNVGDQAIKVSELTGIFGDFGNAVFGFQDRFSDFMYKPNGVHGKLAYGQDLSSFVLQRMFANGPAEISSAFLQIPYDYLDSVFAVDSGVTGLSAWYDAILDYKVSMPLAEFSIPSLQDPAYEHGQSVTLRRNGQIF